MLLRNSKVFNTLQRLTYWFFWEQEWHPTRRDPLSPYLFTITMEGLSCMLEYAVSDGSIKVPHAGPIHISHIIFADDLLIFLQNDSTSVRNLATILNNFGIVSGLQLNHAKSKVYINPCIEDKDVIAHTLGVSEGNLPVTYWVSHSYPLAFTKPTVSLSCKK